MPKLLKHGPCIYLCRRAFELPSLLSSKTSQFLFASPVSSLTILYQKFHSYTSEQTYALDILEARNSLTYGPHFPSFVWSSFWHNIRLWNAALPISTWSQRVVSCTNVISACTYQATIPSLSHIHSPWACDCHLVEVCSEFTTLGV